MIANKQFLLIHRLFKPQKIAKSERIDGATVLEFKEPITFPKLVKLLDYCNVLWVSTDKKTIWIE